MALGSVLRSSLGRSCRFTRAHYRLAPIPSVRRFITSPRLASEDHIQTLLANPEITPEDASNELRWLVEEVRAEASRTLAKGRLPPIEDERVEELVKRRSVGEPLQYILGSTDFGPLTIQCRKPVLIPRPETAHLTTRLSSTILSSVSPLTSSSRPSSPLTILDLCTGTACIPLLLAHLNPLSTAVGVDNSPAAVSLGMLNIKELGMKERVKVRYGNVFGEAFDLLGGPGEQGRQKVGLLVSNPPYIPWREYEQLPASVRDFESPSALLGDGPDKTGDGLKFYDRIGALLKDLLLEEERMEAAGWKEIPRVAVEVGQGQAKAVSEIIRGSGVIGRTEVWEDQYGVERMVVGWTK
ncbi:hypothetical protein IAT38_001185 [Cryptococcus sp. DSM 104549]